MSPSCIPPLRLTQFEDFIANVQVDRSSEEPDGESGSSHYADGGKSCSPGKGPAAGSESPKPGRRRHSRRGSQDFDMMMRAESAGPGGQMEDPSPLQPAVEHEPTQRHAAPSMEHLE